MTILLYCTVLSGYHFIKGIAITFPYEELVMWNTLLTKLHLTHRRPKVVFNMILASKCIVHFIYVLICKREQKELASVF